MTWDKIYKTTATAAGAVAGIFGGWDTLLKVMLAFIVIDGVTGLMTGALGRSGKTESGHLSSSACWAGLIKKAGELMAVIIGVLLDMLAVQELGFQGAVFRTAIMIYIIATEGLSIVENLGKIGVPFPAFVNKALEQLRDKADKTAPKGDVAHDGDE